MSKREVPRYLKIRSKVKPYVDMDYIDRLEEKDSKFMRQFVDEYYCGSYWKEGSLHRRAFGKKYKTKIKKEMETNMNAQNRCLESAEQSLNRIQNIDDFKESLYIPKDESFTATLKTQSPKEAFDGLISEYADLASIDDNSSKEELMREFSLKAITLYLLIKKLHAKPKNKVPKNKTKSNKSKPSKINSK